MTYRHILVGTDLSEAALHAAHAARRLASAQTRIRVANVADKGPQPGTVGANAAREELAAWCERAGLPAAEQVILEGNAAHALAREADACGADLIVVGHRGRNPLERPMLGSTARSLVREARTDVLVARGAPASPTHPPFQDVLVATDLYAPSALAARRALRLAKETGASLSVVYAIEPGVWHEAVAHTARDEFPEGAETWLRGQYGKMLSEFNGKHLDGLAKEHMTHGEPPRSVADQARLQDADLIVVGTHGARAVERLLLGANAEAIVERAPCSVLVVRRAEA